MNSNGMKAMLFIWTLPALWLATSEGAPRKYDMPRHASWNEIGFDGSKQGPPVEYIIDGMDWCAVLVLEKRTFVAAEVRGQIYCTDAQVDLRGFSPFERLLPAFNAVNRDQMRGKNDGSLSRSSVSSNEKSATMKGEFDPVLGFPKHLVWQIDGETETTSFTYSAFKRLTHTKAMKVIAERLKGVSKR